jgi:pilus assembly protein FimV
VAPTASAERASITVATGDTLRAIARRAGARTESEAQSLMIAIFRANPKGFEGNINRLHRGAVLSMPTPAEVAAVSSTEAKREVRAQMTAWRLEGRQGATPRYAAVPAAPSTTTAGAATASVASAADPAGATLANRVQSLEQQLDDMHKLLADENARLQSLQPAAPAAAPAAPAGVIAAAPVAAAPIAAAPIAPAAHPHAAANSAELVRSPILASARANTPSADAQDTQIHLARTAEIFGPVALTLGLMVAGFAYLRRRLSHAPEPEDATAGIAPPPAVPAWEPTAAPAATAYAPAASVPPVDEPISPMEAFRPSAMEESMSRASNETTSNLEIDIEALERSYLESMPGSSATDDAAPVFDGMADDPLLADTAKVDVQARDGAMRASDRPEPQAPQKVDFDLVDLDATAQHVHMPSGLNDAPAVAERRTNIVDVLKSAIERDPKRSDLRMKLLETYYTLASSNQRAFMDAVRKLQRERDLLSADDWQKVTMMGRDIAGDDILFADLDLQKNNGDLANCA